MSTICSAQTCTFEWCDAPAPTIAGQKVEGKDNCGNYCSKFGIEVVKEVIVEVPQECPAQENGNMSVTLTKDANGNPVFNASCPSSSRFNEWEYKMYQEGFRIKFVKRGDKYFAIYEKP
jgi:hypothetical protein